ncbi:MAG: peptidoglycan-associated lipoprotein Pal [Gammaproteobacteria bacterium]|nr:peptidoglycan-associated lipoprotein Pal [Gammaproteobacteria bacterium]
MSIKTIKQILVVGFLGFTLVGCSSTPKTDEADTGKQEATDQVNSDIAAERLAAAEALAAKQAELLASLKGKVVHFDFDSSDVKSSDYAVIKANADYLTGDSSLNVTVKGHGDERGSREYNLALGERRANAVKNALVSEGVSPSRITVISFGEDAPVDEAHTEAAWTKNRRAEFSY